MLSVGVVCRSHDASVWPHMNLDRAPLVGRPGGILYDQVQQNTTSFLRGFYVT